MDCILALDTSGDLCSVGLSHHGRLNSLTHHTPRQHSQKLLAMVDELLASNDLQASDLDAIAFGRGPGSFTGIRICLSVAQGLAFALDIPLIPVSTLRTIAQASLRCGLVSSGQRLLVVSDARMQEIYRACYEIITTGNRTVVPKIIGVESIALPSDLAADAFLQNGGGENLVIVGSGLNYGELSGVAAAGRYSDPGIDATDMLELIANDPAAHMPLAAHLAQPVYLRDSVAWKKRQRIRN